MQPKAENKGQESTGMEGLGTLVLAYTLPRARQVHWTQPHTGVETLDLLKPLSLVAFCSSL